MATSTSWPPGMADAPKSKQTITALLVRFVADASPGRTILREFKQPRRMVAVEEVVELADFPVQTVTAEPTEACWIVFVPAGAGKDWLQKAEAWLAAPDQPDAVRPVVIEREDAAIRWRPGRALIQARPERREEIKSALVDFVFYEGELRTLEQAVETHEGKAQADAVLAHRIRHRERKHWKRFGDTIEHLTHLRLAYARLEPQLAKGSRTLSTEARRVMSRLLNRADAENRLEGLSNRLEALEDLYEGANDRVADYRWYRHGHLLEIGIIALLLIECVLVSCELAMHYSEYSKTAVETAAPKDQSDEFRATITKVADGQINFTMKNGTERKLPLAENVMVLKGKIDKYTDEVTSIGSFPGGLKNDLFARASDKGVRVNIVTDKENKKIAEVYVLPIGKKGQ